MTGKRGPRGLSRPVDWLRRLLALVSPVQLVMEDGAKIDTGTLKTIFATGAVDADITATLPDGDYDGQPKIITCLDVGPGHTLTVSGTFFGGSPTIVFGDAGKTAGLTWAKAYGWVPTEKIGPGW